MLGQREDKQDECRGMGIRRRAASDHAPEK